jgi:hypothetical protein
VGEDWEFKILGGDGMGQLRPLLEDIGRMPVDRRPTFRVEICRVMEANSRFGFRQTVELLLLGRVSLSMNGDLWLLSGWLQEDRFLGEGPVEKEFEAVYNTRKRKGYLGWHPLPKVSYPPYLDS